MAQVTSKRDMAGMAKEAMAIAGFSVDKVEGCPRAIVRAVAAACSQQACTNVQRLVIGGQ